MNTALADPAAPWGRFTARGGEAVEAATTALVGRLVAVFASVLMPGEFRCVAMIGGFGRGEGGVLVVDGQERPHNNFDFLVVTENLPLARRQAIKAALDARIQPIVEAAGLGCDVTAVDERTLRWSSCLVIWYDVRFGHKTVLGDAAFLPGLSRFTAERIVPADIASLVVNRGTLLVINDLILESGQRAAEGAAKGAAHSDHQQPSDAGTAAVRPAQPAQLGSVQRTHVIKHVMKAVIGYGDALLFAHGLYHWSYVERQQRMRALSAAAVGMRALYDQAADFRFRPDYAAHWDRDLAAWCAEVRVTLEGVHRVVEAHRLGVADLTWPEHPRLMCRCALTTSPGSLRGWARRGRDVLRSPPCPLPGAGAVARLGWRVLGRRGVLDLTFPVVAYGSMDASLRAMARAALGASGDDPAALRRAYLRRWRDGGDVNFAHTVRRLDLDLDLES